MKRFFLFAVIATFSAVTMFADDNIKRPESANYLGGIAALDQGDVQKGFDLFEAELAENPKNGYAMFYEASIYFHVKQYDNALKCIDNAKKNIPKKDKEWSSKCFALHGDVLQFTGDTLNSVLDYYKAFELYQEVDYLYKLADIYMDQGKIDLLEQTVNTCLMLDKNNASTHIYVGALAELKGDANKAMEEYSQAITLDPNHPIAYYKRGVVYFNSNMLREAVQDFISSLGCSVTEDSFGGIVAVAQKDFDLVISQLQVKQVNDPANPIWSYCIGRLKYFVNDYAAAEAAYLDAQRLEQQANANILLIHKALAELYLEGNKLQDALSQCEIALAIDSTSSDTWKMVGRIFLLSDKAPDAIGYFTNAINYAPNQADFYGWRSRAFTYISETQKAMEDINIAISLNPNEISYLLQRASIYNAMGYAEACKDECKKYLDAQMSLPEAQRIAVLMVYAYAHLGDKADMEEIMKVYDSEVCIPYYEFIISRSYALLNESDKAIEHLDRAFQKGFTDIARVYHEYDFVNLRSTDQFKQLVSKYMGE